MPGSPGASDGAAMREPGSLIWTRRQRTVLASIVLILTGVLLVRAVRHPQRVADPPPAFGPRAVELATKIDPNTADWPAWAALPLIGEKRARQIVDFREAWVAEHPGEACFVTAADLLKVKGIGKVTAAALAPHLAFPGDAGGAATRP
jgi:hypothetical protein